MIPRRARLALLSMVLWLSACATLPPPRDDALYHALGGEAGIAAIVEELLVRIVDDPRIAAQFVDIDLVNLNDRLVEQICVEAGGPCTYTGRTMDEAHGGRDISEAEFNALVEDLQDAMEARGVAVAAQNRLLRRLAPMRADIIHQ